MFSRKAGSPLRRDEELVGQRAVLVEQREVALVHQHGVHGDLLRARARNSSSKEPTMTVGNSARFTTSCEGLRACSSRHEPRRPRSARAACSRMARSRARPRSAPRRRPAQHVHQRVGVGHLVRAGRQEAVPPREVARDEPGELDGHHLRRRAVRSSQRTGRLNCSAAAAPALRTWARSTARTTLASSPGRSSATSREGVRTTAYTYSVPSSSRRSRASTSTPLPRAKPAAALVGLPSASKAILAEGPRNDSSVASVASGTSRTTTIRRRGVEYVAHVAVRHARGVQGARP